MSKSFEFQGKVAGDQVGIGNSIINVGGGVRLSEPEIDVEAALALAASLPVDEVPDPRDHIGLSRNLPERNRYFVGREEQLRAIASSFCNDDAAVIAPDAAVAAGIGGVGKSDLAAQFGYRYGHFFTGGVFWLNFEDPAAIIGQIGQCSAIQDFDQRTVFMNLPLEVQVEVVLDLWRSSEIPRLLIFDNCEDPALLSQWRPSTGRCRVLVTSRIDQWPRRTGLRTVPLDTLPRELSLALLCRYREDLRADDPSLDKIADRLGDLPLALHLAGSYLDADAEETAASYLARVESPTLLQDVSLTAGYKGGTLTDRDKGVAATFMTSLKRLDRDDPVDLAAIHHLALAASLAPGEAIPNALLRAACNHMPGDATERQIRDGLPRLRRVGLVTSEGADHVSMHRLVAHFVGDLVTEAKTALEVMGRALHGEATRINQSGRASDLLPMQAHLRHLANRLVEDDVAVGGYLLNVLGDHLIMLGDLAAALRSYQASHSIFERLAEADPANAGWQRDLSVSQDKIGDVQSAQGDLAAALRSYQADLCIADRLAALDPSNQGWQRDLAISHFNVGKTHRALAATDRAKRAFQNALEILITKVDESDPLTGLVRKSIVDLND